jgi:hypothetical protein
MYVDGTGASDASNYTVNSAVISCNVDKVVDMAATVPWMRWSVLSNFATILSVACRLLFP